MSIKNPGRLLRIGNVARLATMLMALWKLARHPETPRAAKWVAWGTLAYALSPIDLIPDFIPVLGLLDEVVIIPLGIALVIRLTPPEQWQQRLREAEASRDRLPSLRWGIAIIVGIWLLLTALLLWAVVAALSA